MENNFPHSYEKGFTSVIIVNYNGKEYVKKCLDSIVASNTINLEVIVVDNGSTDDSVTYLKNFFKNKFDEKRLKFVELEKNYGPALARNEGVMVSIGEYIGFLDNDTQVHPDWVRSAILAFEKTRNLGALQCKLLLTDKKTIDYVGEYIGSNGFLVQRATPGEIDEGQYDEVVDILAAKSAGMFIRRDVFIKTGGFDKDYFIYVEETDLGWRVWLLGYSVKFIPDSIVYHEFGTSSVILGKERNNFNAKFHGSKNYILTLYKNLNFINLIKILPFHIFLWLGLSFYSLLKGSTKSFLWINRGILWFFLNLGKNTKKRIKVQKMRIVTDTYIFQGINLLKKKRFSYFLDKATKKSKLGNAESFSQMNNEK